MTRLAGGVYVTSLTSNDLAVTLDRSQYDAGSGPCMTAPDGAARRPDAMDGESGYRDFAAAAMRHGVRSSLSLPLTGVPEPAALNLYAETPAAFAAARSQQVAELLARCVAELMSTGPRATTAAPVELAAALTRRRMMRDAEEALMASEQISRAEAFHRLALRSTAEQRSVFDIARELLGTVEPGGIR